MTRLAWAAMGAGVLVVLAFFWCEGRADAAVQAANRRAAIAAAVADAAGDQAEQAIAAHHEALRVIDSLRSGVQRVRVVYRRAKDSVPAPVPNLPAVCASCVARAEALSRALDLADAVIDSQETMIVTLTADNKHLSLSLESVRGQLEAAAASLAEQAKRTSSADHRLFGIVPMPKIVAGYGATLHGGNIRTGPQLTLGWELSL